MANEEHIDILKQGVEIWNQWREEHPKILPHISGVDLNEANLRGINLSNSNLSEANFIRTDFTEADLWGADLRGANLQGAYLSKANFSGADLSGINLSFANLEKANLQRTKLINARLVWARLVEAFLLDADLRGADFSGADLLGVYFDGADLRGADLSRKDLLGVGFATADLRGANLARSKLIYSNFNRANLGGADLSGADLSGVTLIGTNLNKADLTGCRVYGISVWSVELEGAKQDNLVITPEDEPTITIDNLKIAQFIYLLLNNEVIREVIDTITSKVVLILGRFTPERKIILDAIRDELRKKNYSPVLFDFEKPANRDITETVSTLAHLARFIIADITDAKSIPQELNTIVPNLPSVPIMPLLQVSEHEYSMFEHFTRFPWVLPIYHYRDEKSLLQSLGEKVIIPAEQKAKELAKR